MLFTNTDNTAFVDGGSLTSSGVVCRSRQSHLNYNRTLNVGWGCTEQRKGAYNKRDCFDGGRSTYRICRMGEDTGRD